MAFLKTKPSVHPCLRKGPLLVDDHVRFMLPLSASLIFKHAPISVILVKMSEPWPVPKVLPRQVCLLRGRGLRGVQADAE